MVRPDYFWSGRFQGRVHTSTRQLARILRDWISSIGLEVNAFGPHAKRRAKAT